MQHAGIAGESINSVNKGLLKEIQGDPASDLKKPSNVYDVTASVALAVQRLQLTPDDLKRVVLAWHEEGRYETEQDADTWEKVEQFTQAMTRAQHLARELFLTYKDALDAMVCLGSAPKVPEPAEEPA